jgi:hypothetical protein
MKKVKSNTPLSSAKQKNFSKKNNINNTYNTTQRKGK